jgi:outer membrane protein
MILKVRARAMALIVFGLSCVHCCAQTGYAPLANNEPGHLPPLPAATPSQGDSGMYSLPQLIDMGERNNPQARMSWEQAKQAAEGVGISRAELFPALAFDTLALKGNLLFGLPPNISSSGVIKVDSTIVVPAINLSWTVFDSGGNWATYDRAKFLALASKMALNEANEKVALQIYGSYFKLLSAKAQLLAAKTADETSRAVEDSVKLRFTNGLASTVEVTQARALRLASLARLIKATGDVESARVGLAVAVGMHGSQAIDIPAIDQAPSPEVIEASANDLVQQALSKRPDLIEAADRIKAAQYQEKEARSKLWPKIGIIASEMYTNVTSTPSSVAFTDVHGNTYVVAGNLHWDIFDAGAHYRRLQQAKSEVREATDKLDSMRLVAEQEVWNAYTGVTTALAEQDAAQASLDAATESFHLTETAYANGTKQLLDLEQSQSELAKADSAYQTARAQTLMLAAQLAFSTGDLLETGSKLPSAGSGPSQDVK